MIDKSVLDAAKAFLCWEAFDGLSVQLVAVQNAVAYYYPPGNPCHAVVLFYLEESRDFSEPLFLLFHEAGHAKQWSEMQAQKKTDLFQRMISATEGREKLDFEKQAWEIGMRLFADFLRKEKLEPLLFEHFDRYRAVCLQSYEGG